MHLQELVREALTILKRNYILAAPTIISSFLAAFASLVVMGKTPSTSTTIGVGLVISVIGMFAHGVTLAMAREALDTGETSFTTATETSRRVIVPLLSVSIAMTFLILIGVGMFLVPGLLAAFVLLYALPAVVLDEEGAFEAMKKSFNLARTHLADTFVLFTSIVLSTLVLFIINVMLAVIPLLGQLLNVILTGAFGAVVATVVVQVYRRLSPSEESGT